MPVMTAEGLVGRVHEVGPSSARVLLLGDPYCKVSAIVPETGDQGIITSSGDSIIEEGLLEFTFLARRSQVKPGQKVLTSGLGGIFPKGISIGQVVDLLDVGHGLYVETRVKLAANLNQLETVWVVLP